MASNLQVGMRGGLGPVLRVLGFPGLTGESCLFDLKLFSQFSRISQFSWFPRIGTYFLNIYLFREMFVYMNNSGADVHSFHKYY